MTAKEFLKAVWIELELARAKHPRPLADSYDALGVVLEELDEFWDEVKKQVPCADLVIHELAQTGAMVLRAASETGAIDSRDVMARTEAECSRHARVPSWHALYGFLWKRLASNDPLVPEGMLAAMAKAVECVTEKEWDL